MKLCHNCSKLIQDNTVKCPYCGEATNKWDADVAKLTQQMKNKSCGNIFSAAAEKFKALLGGIGYVLGFIIVAPIALYVISGIGYLIYWLFK